MPLKPLGPGMQSHFTFKVKGQRISVSLKDLYLKKADHALTVLTNAGIIALRLGFQKGSKTYEKVRIAALFHDWTKDIHRRGNENTEHLLLAEVERDRSWYESKGIFIDTGIEGHTTNKWIAHAPTSAKMAHDEFGIKDADILRAIAHHQTGNQYEHYREMSSVEKIILLADYIDEGKSEHEDLAMKVMNETGNIDLAILTVFTGTVETELFRTDKVPTPNGNLIRLRGKLYDEFLENDGFAITSNTGEQHRKAIAYITQNSSKIAKLSDGYLSGKL